MRYVILMSMLCVAGCGGDPYGYAPEYAPYGDEDDYFERAQEPSYEDVRRNPAEYTETLLGWFAVVQKVEPGEGAGQYRITFDLRFHQPRHLCSGEFDSSCRVTVSDKSGGPFTALIALHPEDQSGKYRMGPESLVKLYGKALPDFDAQGGPMVRVEYYRHWPPGTYVSIARRRNMRK